MKKTKSSKINKDYLITLGWSSDQQSVPLSSYLSNDGLFLFLNTSVSTKNKKYKSQFSVISLIFCFLVGYTLLEIIALEH